jgi:hypothetical protein
MQDPVDLGTSCKEDEDNQVVIIPPLLIDIRIGIFSILTLDFLISAIAIVRHPKL